MKTEAYFSNYINRGQRSCIWRLDAAKHLISKDGKISGKDVWEVQYHPPFDKVNEYKILKVEITKKKIVYVLIGHVTCFFYDGQKEEWFEIALSQSKEKVEIWKDLHAIRMT